MSEPQRYELMNDDMCPIPDGYYVRHAAYARLEAEKERLEAAIKPLLKQVDAMALLLSGSRDEYDKTLSQMWERLMNPVRAALTKPPRT